MRGLKRFGIFLQQFLVTLVTSDEHDDDGEDLLPGGVGGHVAEADGGQRRARVVQGRHVGLGVGHTAAVGQAHPLGQKI